MGHRNHRRFRRPVAAAAWVVGVFLYWNSFISLAPQDAVPADHQLEFLNLNRDGHMVFAHRDADRSQTGPVTIRDPRQHRFVREHLSADDTILDAVFDARDLAASLRDGVITVSDVSGGQTLVTHNIRGAQFDAHFSPDAKLVCIRDGRDVNVYRLSDGQLLWKKSHDSEVTRARFRGAKLLAVDCQTSKRAYWNTDSWAPDSKFGDLAYYDRTVSPDGRLAIVQHVSPPMRLAIHHLQTEEWLWDLPIRQNLGMQFNEDGSEIQYRSIHRGRLHVARWNSSDGRVITPLPPKLLEGDKRFGEVSLYQFSPDRRFVVVETVGEIRKAPSWLTRVTNALGSNWSGLWPISATIWVVDSSTGEVMGFVTSAQRFLRNFELDFAEFSHITNAGFVVHQRGQPTRYYSLPPRRNWWWLVSWALGPLILLRLIVSARAVFRPAT